jgi:hypothetical protein
MSVPWWLARRADGDDDGCGLESQLEVSSSACTALSAERGLSKFSSCGSGRGRAERARDREHQKAQGPKAVCQVVATLPPVPSLFRLCVPFFSLLCGLQAAGLRCGVELLPPHPRAHTTGQPTHTTPHTAQKAEEGTARTHRARGMEGCRCAHSGHRRIRLALRLAQKKLSRCAFPHTAVQRHIQASTTRLDTRNESSSLTRTWFYVRNLLDHFRCPLATRPNSPIQLGLSPTCVRSSATPCAPTSRVAREPCRPIAV